jgi:hypothetical protein
VGASSIVVGRGSQFVSLPNPISESTRLSYVVGRDAGARGPVEVSVGVHDVRGRLVRELRAGPQQMGPHEVVWDTNDASGQRVAAGVYYLRLRAGKAAHSSKVIVLR